MTNEQFKQLMDKLDQMQRQMDAKTWWPVYPVPPAPFYPSPVNPFVPFDPFNGGTRD